MPSGLKYTVPIEVPEAPRSPELIRSEQLQPHSLCVSTYHMVIFAFWC